MLLGQSLLAVRKWARSRGSDLGEMSPWPRYGLACLPQYASGHTLGLAKDQ